ncbi:MAG TPA: glycosyltransferase family 2 protein [Gaiellaceae bacterium]|nr:glycosyltransferase family 2 protein [Gaiellaceae bacterium]
MTPIEWILLVLVFTGTVPALVGCYQFALAALHCFRRQAPVKANPFPRVAVVVPAWNEGSVIGRTVDQLLAADYPADHLRIYVVDDASTDETADIARAKSDEHPGVVRHLRRAHGGGGKAHTINHGLEAIEADDWHQAVLIIDADVLFAPTALARMTRHFADADVGAVSAYIKEGSSPDNYLTRFVAFEYVTAEAAARRAQNMIGAQACLAGGAQLISRASLDAIGGRIDTSTLAEDTVTTFLVQLHGRRVVFEPSAIVWAEEPSDLRALWRQRVRWGRGNVRVTFRFRRVWFRRFSGKPLGTVSFGLMWFSVALMPVLMVTTSAALLGLYAIDRGLSSRVFSSLWEVGLVTYLFITLSSFSIDPATARRAWREGIAFPGLISLAIIVGTADPHLASDATRPVHGTWRTVAVLFVYAWLATSMLAAYALKRLEDVRRLRLLVAPLLYLVGYGPLLCAMTGAAYIRELRGTEARWEKTVKTGKVRAVG